MYLWRHCNGGQKEGKKERKKLIFFFWGSEELYV